MDSIFTTELVVLTLVLIFSPAALALGCWLAKMWHN